MIGSRKAMPQLFVTGLDGCSARLRQRLSAWPALGIAWLGVGNFGSGGRGKSDFDVTPLHERVHYDCVVFGFRTLSSEVVDRPDAQRSSHARGDVLSAISDGMVALLKEFYGHGPTRTKSYYADDLVVCVLRGGFSRVEQTLLEGGRGAAVIQQRMEFQEQNCGFVSRRSSSRPTGRRVIGFMSGNQQHPDMMCEVFILDPADLVDHDEELPGDALSA